MDCTSRPGSRSLEPREPARARRSTVRSRRPARAWKRRGGRSEPARRRRSRTKSLAEGLGALARRFTAETGVRVRTRHCRCRPAAGGVESELFRIAGEALTNVRKHARAREASLRLERGAPPAASDRHRRRRRVPRRAARGSRLRPRRAFEDRARAVGGRAAIRSAPGRGTTVTVTVPLTKRRAPIAGDRIGDPGPS